MSDLHGIIDNASDSSHITTDDLGSRSEVTTLKVHAPAGSAKHLLSTMNLNRWPDGTTKLDIITYDSWAYADPKVRADRFGAALETALATATSPVEIHLAGKHPLEPLLLALNRGASLDAQATAQVHAMLADDDVLYQVSRAAARLVLGMAVRDGAVNDRLERATQKVVQTTRTRVNASMTLTQLFSLQIPVETHRWTYGPVRLIPLGYTLADAYVRTQDATRFASYRIWQRSPLTITPDAQPALVSIPLSRDLDLDLRARVSARLVHDRRPPVTATTAAASLVAIAALGKLPDVPSSIVGVYTGLAAGLGWHHRIWDKSGAAARTRFVLEQQKTTASVIPHDHIDD